MCPIQRLSVYLFKLHLAHVALVVVGAFLIVASLAFPAPAAAGDSDGVWDCRYLPSGALCIRYINGYTGVDMKYVKDRGGAIRARFAYHDDYFGQWYWDQGWFTEYAGQSRSFAWNGITPGYGRGRMYVRGQGYFVTNYLSPPS